MSDLPSKLRYGVVEAGLYLDVHASTIRRLVEHGQLEASKIGGQIKIAKEVLDKYIEDHKIDPFF